MLRATLPNPKVQEESLTWARYSFVSQAQLLSLVQLWRHHLPTGCRQATPPWAGLLPPTPLASQSDGAVHLISTVLHMLGPLLHLSS